MVGGMITSLLFVTVASFSRMSLTLSSSRGSKYRRSLV
jgi:hypothetical protein